jgi:hypothetical protein
MTSALPSDANQPTAPNAARIYNYTLGGSYYYPVDQAAAEYIFSLVPSTQKWVRMGLDSSFTRQSWKKTRLHDTFERRWSKRGEVSFLRSRGYFPAGRSS